ncbi:MAG: hypothetical protein ACHQWV_05385, partial [Nitrospirales bacterium]
HIGGSGDGEIERKQHRNHSWEHAHQGLHRNASVLLGTVLVSILRSYRNRRATIQRSGVAKTEDNPAAWRHSMAGISE